MTTLKQVWVFRIGTLLCSGTHSNCSFLLYVLLLLNKINSQKDGDPEEKKNSDNNNYAFHINFFRF